MSNVETVPEEVVCGGDTAAAELVTPRDVPLGGPRAMTVRRTLPRRTRSLIGAWCFLDHYGPDRVADTGGMAVPGHPHTGLATVSWLFTGEVEHRDTTGAHAVVRPGELNLMTAGSGIAHSEFSTPGTEVLHGVQLWLALPAAHRDTAPRFEHYAPPRVRAGDVALRVFLGSLAGSSSPVETFTPLLGAEVVLPAGAAVTLDVDAGFEHGVLVDTGAARVCGTAAASAELVYLPPGRTTRTCTPATTAPAGCCSAGRRWASRSSCGGTSSVPPTTRSRPSGSSGRTSVPPEGGTVGASGCSRTPGSRRCRRRSCRTRG